MRLASAILVSALFAGPAAAQTGLFPARSGESGLLDVPDAEVVGVGNGILATELRLDSRRSGVEFGPLPVYAAAGVSSRLELGLSMRDGGQPGDPDPARMLFGGALKLRLLNLGRALPRVAADAYVDRLNGAAVWGGRLIASTPAVPPLRAAAFVGYEFGDESDLTYGGAVSVGVRSSVLVLEALTGPRGLNYGAALRRRVWQNVPASIGFNYFPGDDTFRVSLGFAFVPAGKPAAPPAAAPKAAPEPSSAETPPAVPQFADDQPRFRLKMRSPDPSGGEPRTLRHAPWVAAAPGAAKRGAAAPAVRAAAPSMDDLADAQIREQEVLADARERRVRDAAEQLGAREKATGEEAARLAEHETELASREQQLEARTKRGAFRGPPTPQQRELEVLEVQLASQERNLSAQERSFVPALDAAQGRERDAAAREDGERQEANRLAASVSGSTSRALQVEIRKQALGARSRQLAALEARLIAKGERIDALERQLRTKGERLGTWQRRLDARSDRLDLLERAAAEAKAPTPAIATPAEAKAGPGAKDKPVFVMVVKSPTAIVKERSAAPTAQSASAALHAGVAVEKAVAAATIVIFPTPTTEMSELDRDTIDGIAKLAAKDGCELLIWARAKDPSFTADAQRRANEIRSRVLASGPLDPKQVVIRVTTRPGAQGVDVVVSALRETAKAATVSTNAPAGAALLHGESGKRQIREAVQTAQPSIEACVGDTIVQKSLQRAEGVLKLTISTSGRVTKVLAGDGALSGGALEQCLGKASSAWLFPADEAEYIVDVPITVIRGGAR